MTFLKETNQFNILLLFFQKKIKTRKVTKGSKVQPKIKKESFAKWSDKYEGHNF